MSSVWTAWPPLKSIFRRWMLQTWKFSAVVSSFLFTNFQHSQNFRIHYPSDRRIEKLASNLEAILQVNAYGYQVACKILASFSIHLQESCKLIDSLARFLQAFRFILQDYLQDESKSLQESCKLFDSNAGKGGKHRKGADFCSSKIVLALAWAFLAFLRSRAGALLCSIRSAPGL